MCDGGWIAKEVAVVGVACDEAERATFAAATDHQRGAWALDGVGVGEGVDEVIVLPVVGCAALGHEGVDDVDGFFEPF